MSRVLVAVYLAAIVAANLSVEHWGPNAAIYNAFLLIGLDLTSRDRLHDLWHGQLLRNMALLIAAGSALSYIRDLIGPIRELLETIGMPWVIENVPGAPLRAPVVVCGSSLGLKVRRHRLFESNVPLMVAPCAHALQHEARYWTSWRPNGEKRLAKVVQVYGNAGDSSQWADAMGIDWMNRNELREAIPPAYTELIGHQLMQHVRQVAWA